MQVWQGGSMTRWHGVVVTPDSVSGVSWLEDAQCDSCRVSVPRSSVDSIRLGNPTAGLWKTVGLVAAIVAVPIIVFCAANGCPQGD